MPAATPAMLQALDVFIAHDKNPQDPNSSLDNVTTHVWQALAVRGLVTPFPNPSITPEGYAARESGRVPRIHTSRGITFARLDSGPKPRHYKVFIRDGYRLERHETNWYLSNDETGEKVRVPFAKDQSRTVNDAVRNAAPIVRSWIDRDSSTHP